MTDDAVARAREALERARATALDWPHSAGLTETLDQIAQALAKLADGQRNLTVQQALLDARLLRVERNRLFNIFNRLVFAGTRLLGRVRSGLPGPAAEDDEDPAYRQWVEHEAAAQPSAESARETANHWAYRPNISVLLTVRSGDFLADCLDSLRRQVYENFELCAAVERPWKSKLEGLPVRVRTISADGLDDAQAWNAAAGVAVGEYFCVLPETGVLSPLAFHYLVEALQEAPAGILYSDEDSLDGERRRVRPIFKPGWSPELLLSQMYMGNLLAIRGDCWHQAGGVSSATGQAGLHDLVLRLTAAPVGVHRIGRVLYHEMRTKTASGARQVPRSSSAEAVTAIVCSKSPKLLETCLHSIRATAGAVIRQIVVVAHEENGPNPELHSLIDRAGAEAISFGGPFHFAEMNNLGAKKAANPNLLFLNDDIRATSGGWAELLAVQLSRAEIGIAGAVLWYPSGTLQHAGIVVGIGEGVGHAGRYQRPTALWPWLLAARDVSAVTGACLAIRRDLFQRVGGFDRTFPNNYNDVDLCFRVRTEGYRVICVPAPGLTHAECQSRPGVVRFAERYRFYDRWAGLLRCPDPYYSRALAPEEKIALNLSGEDWYRGLTD